MLLDDVGEGVPQGGRHGVGLQRANLAVHPPGLFAEVQEDRPQLGLEPLVRRHDLLDVRDPRLARRGQLSKLVNVYGLLAMERIDLQLLHLADLYLGDLKTTLGARGLELADRLSLELLVRLGEPLAAAFDLLAVQDP